MRMTVSVGEALTRLENLGLGIPAEERKAIEDIQRIRNRIEHPRYDHKERRRRHHSRGYLTECEAEAP